MPEYEYVWEFTGKTTKSSDTHAYSLGSPIDPFPFDKVVETARIAILSETSQKMSEEFLKHGITATITLIEPEVNIITELYDVRQIKDHEHNYWHHWLEMKAKVYFTTDKPLEGSPFDPFTWAAIFTITKYLVGIIAAALVIYGIAMKFIESFLVNKHTITYIDPETGLPVTEEWTTPSISGQIGIVIIIIIFLILLLGVGGLGLTKGKTKK